MLWCSPIPPWSQLVASLCCLEIFEVENKKKGKKKKEMKACRKMGKDIRIKMFLKKKKKKKKEKERKKEAEVCSSLCHSSCNSNHQRETTPWPACRCRRQPELRWGAGQSAARRRSDTWRRAGGRARPAQCGAAPGSSRRPRVLLRDQKGPQGSSHSGSASPARNGLDISASPAPFSLSASASGFNILELRHSRLPEGLEN